MAPTNDHVIAASIKNVTHARDHLMPTNGRSPNWVNVIEAGDYEVVAPNNGPERNPAVDVRGEIRLTNLLDDVGVVSKRLAKAAPLDVVCAHPDLGASKLCPCRFKTDLCLGRRLHAAKRFLLSPLILQTPEH